MSDYFSTRELPQNVWLGVTVECRSSKIRIDHLRTINAIVKFSSCKPLIEDLGMISLKGTDWSIVEDESGPNTMLSQLDWVMIIKQQVELLGVAFFFKQWGS